MPVICDSRNKDRILYNYSMSSKDEMAKNIPKHHKRLDEIANFWMNMYKFERRVA